MSESVFVVKFAVESEAYQAFSELKTAAITNDYVISQAFLVKNEGGKIIDKDEFDTGIETVNDMGAGSLIGALVGIIGGPTGMLLGMGTGLLIGGAVDTLDIADNNLLINQVSSSVNEGETAILMLISETNEGAFTAFMSKYLTTVFKFDAGEVAEEVEKAAELERRLRKEAREQMLAEKKAEQKENIEQQKARIHAYFEYLKEYGESTDAQIDPKLLD